MLLYLFNISSSKNIHLLESLDFNNISMWKLSFFFKIKFTLPRLEWFEIHTRKSKIWRVIFGEWYLASDICIPAFNYRFLFSELCMCKNHLPLSKTIWRPLTGDIVAFWVKISFILKKGCATVIWTARSSFLGRSRVMVNLCVSIWYLPCS